MNIFVSACMELFIEEKQYILEIIEILNSNIFIKLHGFIIKKF